MQTIIQSALRQLNQQRQSLDLRPEQIDLSDVLPIFVPASFFAHGKWVGPYSRLRAQGIGLTWSVLQPNQTMRYVDFGMTEHWEAQQIDWKDLAMKNLRRMTENCPGLRQMARPNGELASVAFMFEDGCGPSRLLFRGTLGQWFPNGYRVAIPEMSSGFAYAADLDGETLSTITGVIDHCYRNGTRPLAPGTFEPDDLLPAE